MFLWVTPVGPEFWRTRWSARILEHEFKRRARHRMRIVPSWYEGVFVNVYRGEGTRRDHALFRRIEQRALELIQSPIEYLERRITRITQSPLP